ncbi:MAG: InlB B-repeat-containing protein, partial [Clostridia bacterium]|nr:InlB B-repeat-containing protein [Clostridia bacterium]
MKKLTKSFKILIISVVSILVATGVALGLVFGLRNKSKNNTNFTDAQVELLSELSSVNLSKKASNVNDATTISGLTKDNFIASSSNFVVFGDSSENFVYAKSNSGYTNLSEKLAHSINSEATNLQISNAYQNHFSYTYKLNGRIFFAFADFENGEIKFISEFGYELSVNDLPMHDEVEFYPNVVLKQYYYVFEINHSNSITQIVGTYTENSVLNENYIVSTNEITDGNLVKISYDDGKSFYTSFDSKNYQIYSINDKVIRKNVINLEGATNLTNSESFIFAEFESNYKFFNKKLEKWFDVNPHANYDKLTLVEYSCLNYFGVFEQKVENDNALEDGLVVYYDLNLNEVLTFESSAINGQLPKVLYSTNKAILVTNGILEGNKKINPEYLKKFDFPVDETVPVTNDYFIVPDEIYYNVYGIDGDKIENVRFAQIGDLGDGFFFARNLITSTEDGVPVTNEGFYLIDINNSSVTSLSKFYIDDENLNALMAFSTGYYLTTTEVPSVYNLNKNGEIVKDNVVGLFSNDGDGYYVSLSNNKVFAIQESTSQLYISTLVENIDNINNYSVSDDFYDVEVEPFDIEIDPYSNSTNATSSSGGSSSYFTVTAKTMDQHTSEAEDCYAQLNFTFSSGRHPTKFRLHVLRDGWSNEPYFWLFFTINSSYDGYDLVGKWGEHNNSGANGTSLTTKASGSSWSYGSRTYTWYAHQYWSYTGYANHLSASDSYTSVTVCFQIGGGKFDNPFMDIDGDDRSYFNGENYNKYKVTYDGNTSTYGGTIPFSVSNENNMIEPYGPAVEIVDDGGGGGSSYSNPTIVTYQSSFTTLPSYWYTRSNYTFLGWSTSQSSYYNTNGFSGSYTSASTSYTYSTIGNTTLYAIWRPNWVTSTKYYSTTDRTYHYYHQMHRNGMDDQKSISVDSGTYELRFYYYAVTESKSYDYVTATYNGTTSSKMGSSSSGSIDNGYVSLSKNLSSTNTVTLTAHTDGSTSNPDTYVVYVGVYKYITITFAGNGGTNGTTSYVETLNGSSTTVGTLPSTSRTGYTFDGWYTAESGGSQISASTSVSANTTYYAHWTPNKYTVRYHIKCNASANGSGYTYYDQTNLSYGTSYNYVSYATAIANSASGNVGYWDEGLGWSFNKWLSSASTSGTATGLSGSFSNLTSTNNAIVTVFAQYSRTKTVVYNSNKPSGASTSISGSMTSTTWTQYTCTVKDGDNIKDSMYTPQSYTYSLPANAYSLSGYTFQGWATSSTGSVEYSNEADYTPSRSCFVAPTVNLYAKWSANAYTVTYKANGGSGSDRTQDVTFDSSFTTILCNYRKSDYQFYGWSTDSSSYKGSSNTLAGSYTSAGTSYTYTTAGNTTLYAIWMPYWVTADTAADGSEIVSGGASDPENYRVPYGSCVCSSGSGVNYYLVQYYTEDPYVIFTREDGDTDSVYMVVISLDSGIVLTDSNSNYPSWTFEQEYTYNNVTYYVHLYQWFFSESGRLYVFMGGSESYEINSQTGVDLTLYSSDNYYDRVFEFLFGGDSGSSSGERVYHFYHYLSRNSINHILNVALPSGEYSLKAYWYAKSEASHDYGRATFNGTPTSKFTSSSSGTATTGVYDISKTTASNTLTLEAHTDTSVCNDSYIVRIGLYKVITISFNGNGGSSDSKVLDEVRYDSNATLGTLPSSTRLGYTFNGWYTASSGGSQISASTSVGANVTYYAHWTANTYNISYSTTNRTVAEVSWGTNHPTTATYDSQFTVSNPTLLGYDFAGWSITGMYDGDTHYYGSSTTTGTTIDSTTATTFKNLHATNNATVYFEACWTPHTYTISYNLNKGTGSTTPAYGTNHPTSGTYDTSFTVNNPTRTGYLFAGWTITGMDSTTHTYGSNTTTATSLSGVTATSFKNLRATAGTVTFTAQWTAITYTVRYNIKSNSSAKVYYDQVCLYDQTYSYVSYETAYTNSSAGNVGAWTQYGWSFGWWSWGDFYKFGGSTHYSGEFTNLLSTNGSVRNMVAMYTRTLTINYSSNKPSAASTTISGSMTGTTKSQYVYPAYDYSGSDNTMYTTSLSAYDLPANGYSLTGYKFIGWATSSNGDVEYADGASYRPSRMFNLNPSYTPLYAKWEKIKYTIRYNFIVSGFSVATYDTTNHEFDTEYTLQTYAALCSNVSATQLTENSWSFIGWVLTPSTNNSLNYSSNASAKFNNCQTTLLTATDGGVVNFYSKFTRELSISFNSNKPSAATASISGTMSILKPTPTNQYYCAYQDAASYPSTNSVTITKNAFTLTGWTFQGWSLSASGSKNFNDEGTYTWNTPTGSNVVTLYAVWAKNAYSIVYNANKPSSASTSVTGTMANTAAYYDTNVTLRTNAYALTGYTFKGWATSASGSKVYDDGQSFTKPNFVSTNGGTYNIYAVWQANTYVVSYNLSKGSASTTPAHGTTHPTSATFDTWFYVSNPSKEGYTFTGWTISGMGTAVAKSYKYSSTGTVSTIAAATTSSTVAAAGTTTYLLNLHSTQGSTVTLTANWSANTYTVSYDLAKGSASTTPAYGTNHPTSGTFDTAFTVNNPTKEGYTFTGWKITGMDSTTHTYGSNTTTNTSISSTKETSFKNLRATAGTV